MASNTDRITRDEAHDLYMQIFDGFALGFGDVDDIKRTKAVVEAINVRLADAGSQQTIVADTVNGAEHIWQCFQTYDSWSTEQAEAEFNRVWPAELVMDAIAPKAAKPKASKPSTSAPSALCRCGCKSQTTRGKGYLPGHDARHASAVARAILADKSQSHLLDRLPTRALRNKALAQIGRGTAAQAQVKTAKAIRNGTATVERRDGVVDGYVVVNRKHVPAQTFISSDGQRMNINDAADGSGDWLDAEGYLDKPQQFWLRRFTPGAIPTTAKPRKASPKARRPRRPGGDGPEALKSLLTF